MLRAARRVALAAVLAVSALVVVPGTAQAGNDGNHSYGSARHSCTWWYGYCGWYTPGNQWFWHHYGLGH